MILAAIVLNRKTMMQALHLYQASEDRIDLFVPENLIEEAKALAAAYKKKEDVGEKQSGLQTYQLPHIKGIEGKIKSFNKELFSTYEGIIYIMAMGIVVRSIAPYLGHKSKDPAILCLSPEGKYMISVLSGHLGGANHLCRKLAKAIDATPVITTASDVFQALAVDLLAKDNQLLLKDFEGAKTLTALSVEGKTIEIISPYPLIGEQLERKNIIYEPRIGSNISNPIDRMPEFVDSQVEGVIDVTYRLDRTFDCPWVRLIPKVLVVGMGCRKGISQESLMLFLKETFEKNQLSVDAIKIMASIELKAKERGLLGLAADLNIPFVTYSTKLLKTIVDPFEGSSFVQKITGVKAVATPSAYLASKGGRCIVTKESKDGMTISIWEEKQ